MRNILSSLPSSSQGYSSRGSRVFVGIMFSLSLVGGAFANFPTASPTGTLAPSGGYFSQYFQNLTNATCGNGQGVTGFSSTAGNGYLTPLCNTLFWGNNTNGGIQYGDNVSIGGNLDVGHSMNVNQNLNVGGSVSFSSGIVNGNLNVDTLNNVNISNIVTRNPTNYEANYIPKIDANFSLVNSLLYESGGNIGIGTSSPTVALDVSGGLKTTQDILINGIPFGRGGGNISSSIALGINTLQVNSGIGNIAIGSSALRTNTTGEYNVANGLGSLEHNTTGQRNVALGSFALSSNTTGNYNIALGEASLALNQGGIYNVANGGWALYSNTSGTHNVALGGLALHNNISGSQNTAIGYSAGANLTTGSNNIFIGMNANPSSPAASNELNIGNWIYGQNGNIGIGTSSPTARLEVMGTNFNQTTALITSSGGSAVSATQWPAGWGGGLRTWDILGASAKLISRLSVGYRIDTQDLYVSGTLNIPTGASSGKVLTSDANGKASWQSVESDNMTNGFTPFQQIEDLYPRLADGRMPWQETTTTVGNYRYYCDSGDIRFTVTDRHFADWPNVGTVYRFGPADLNKKKIVFNAGDNLIEISVGGFIGTNQRMYITSIASSYNDYSPNIGGAQFKVSCGAPSVPNPQTYDLFGCACNGGEQINEHNIIKEKMMLLDVYGSSDVSSSYRDSTAHFQAINGGYFMVNGVNLGSNITLVHGQDWIRIEGTQTMNFGRENVRLEIWK